MPKLEEKSCCYVHETHSIGCSDGELYLSHEGGTIVFNVTTLFADLPSIVVENSDGTTSIECVIYNN